MIEAYKNYWKQYADFTGRTDRPGFWWPALMNFIISSIFGLNFILLVVIVGLGMVAEYDSTGDVTSSAVGLGILGIFMWVIAVIWVLVNFVPNLAIIIRRLRDAGYDWPWIFLAFVPIGNIVLLVFLCQPTKAPMFTNYQGYYNQTGSNNGYQQGFPGQNPSGQQLMNQGQAGFTNQQMSGQVPQQPVQGATVQQPVQTAFSESAAAPVQESNSAVGSESNYTGSPFQ
ncbi:DUF805 domain-containing protein [Streptococcus tangpeifui]|uniref:DUF805 domain-containing protein n=1 Tax=Streptococcus tangpeifui TaxID=2709400 RepID=UPI0013EAEDCA|nr:DUF805 domain-containing protein [Streptococcus sp. ZJ373]